LNLKELLQYIVQAEGVSDLHLTINSNPIVRIGGNLKRLKNYPVMTKEYLDGIKEILMNEHQIEEFKKEGGLDFSYSISGLSRFRINAYHQRKSIAFAIRIIPQEIPTIKSLGLPEIIEKLALQKNGLILCTGPTGSGKSTTLASMINLINETKAKHILTLEDPIEYIHNHKSSVVHQREIGEDVKDFNVGLRSALRQDPDVILIGEMRDLETISIALKAAETGHLVLATLHTNSASSTIHRIVDSFPPEQQQQVKLQLSSSLKGIISQQLIQRKNSNNRIVNLEILISTPAVQNLIREGKIPQIDNAIQTGMKFGMIAQDNHLLELYQNGDIDLRDALKSAKNLKRMKEKLDI
jgi:twitching motility protein PilT